MTWIRDVLLTKGTQRVRFASLLLGMGLVPSLGCPEYVPCKWPRLLTTLGIRQGYGDTGRGGSFIGG